MRNTILCLALVVLTPLALANNPIPFIVSTTPASAQPGAASFTLKVYGANFVNGSVVRWIQNQTTTALTTTYVSAHELTATVPASLLAAPGTGALTVGGASPVSNVVYFPVGPPTTPAYNEQDQTVGNGPVSVAVADLNGDNIPDLVVANSQDNTVTILLGKGDGTFLSSTVPVGSQPVFVTTGDFNGDGIPDVVVANYGDNTLTILINNGDGTFTIGRVITGIGNQPTSLAAGDFNADGNMDLVVVCQTSVDILFGAGDGTFPNAEQLSGDSYVAVAAADFNNDGFLDFAIEDTAGLTLLVINNGQGNFNIPGSLEFNGSAYLAAGDLKGDGNADLAGTAANATSGAYRASVYFSDGAGQFDSQTFALAAPSWGVAIAPLNGGGSSELALVEGTNTIVTEIYNGSWTAGPSFTANVGSQLTQLALADFNGDGILDMVAGNQSGNMLAILLSAAPFAGLSPSSLTFAAQADGTSSASQPVTIGNTGGGSLLIGTIAASGDYSQTNNCGAILAPGASCTVNVTFTPTAPGTRNGSLTVTDNSNGQANSTQTATLTGTGFIPTPIVGLLPSVIGFGSQQVGTVSNSQSFPLYNTGNGALTILGVGTTGPFAQNNNCGVSLAAGASCTINVVFAPAGTGLLTGTVGIVDNNDNVADSLQIVNLSGTGTPVPAVAGISPGSLTFFSQLVGTASEPQAVTLSNAASAGLLTISSIAASGDFSETGNCGGSLAPGTSCTINVTFEPTVTGARTGTLTVTDNNHGVTGSTQTVSLNGWGRPAGENAAPFISDISPVSAAPGGQGFVLTVRGSGFTVPELDWQVGKTVTKLTASDVTKESFTVTIPAHLIATSHTATLTAVNPDSTPASGVSNPMWFPVASPTASAIFSLTAVKDDAAPNAVATADFNGDGKADLAVANADGTISIFLGNGKGGFRLASTPSAGNGAEAVAVGDFNGDGKPDLAVVNPGSGTVTILLGAGDGCR